MPRLTLTYDQVLHFFTKQLSPEAAKINLEFLQRDIKAAGGQVASAGKVNKGGRPKGSKNKATAAGAAAVDPVRQDEKVEAKLAAKGKKKSKKKKGKKGSAAATAAAPADGAPAAPAAPETPAPPVES